MMEPFSAQGIWWLPGQPERRASGSLTFANDSGVRLSLVGTLEEEGVESIEARPLEPAIQDAELISGLTVDGKLLSLFDCTNIGRRWSVPGLTADEWQARVLFLGGHFEDVTEMAFDRAFVGFSYLADWLGGFHPELEWDASGAVPAYKMRYSVPDSVSAETTAGRISSAYSFATSGDLLTEITAQQVPSLEIKLVKPMTLNELMDGLIRPLQNFLTLGTAHANSITQLTLYSSQVTVSSINGEREWPAPLQVYFSQIYHAERRPRRLIPSEMLFSLSDIEAEFNTLLSKWIIMSTPA